MQKTARGSNLKMRRFMRMMGMRRRMMVMRRFTRMRMMSILYN